MVHVNIQDVNDNGPFFSSFNVTVAEGQPANTPVTILSQFTNDLDGPGNQGPFTYSYKSGSPMEYEYFTIESNGAVKTKKVLDRETQAEFWVPVVVKDAGQPAQSSTLTFRVLVQDINDNGPKPRYLNIYLSLFDNQLMSGPIANVEPLDDDLVGSYTCTLEGNSNTAVFTIDSGCDLKLRQVPTKTEYTLHVSGKSEKDEIVSYDVVVKISPFDNSTVEHSTVLQIDATTASNFMQTTYTSFQSSLEAHLGTSDKIHMFGLSDQPSGSLLINLAVSNNLEEYYSKDQLIQKLSAGKSQIEKDTSKYIASLDFTGCKENHCKNNGQCDSHVTVQGTNHVAESPYQVFTNPTLLLNTYCRCQPEFTGPDCSQPATPCGSIYCQNGATCVTNGNQPTCSCPATWTGQKCDQDVNECATPGYCRNGGSCVNTLGGFNCQCAEGYFGKQCEDGENYCKSSPCVHGQCQNQPDGFVCLCDYGHFGQTCDKSSLGFYETSYMEYQPLTSFQSLEAVFATEAENALLLYNPVKSGNTDKFVALEIVGGNVRFSISVGVGDVNRLEVTKPVNNAHWFRARIVINSQMVGT